MLKKDSKEIVYIGFSKNNLKIYNHTKKLTFKFYTQNINSKKSYNKIKNKIKNKKIIISLEKETYLKKEVYEEEIFKIENYIQEVCIEELKKESNQCFIKYYKIQKKYILYFFDREFIEKIIEYCLDNKIIIESICIDLDSGFLINDYDLILKQIKRINCKLIGIAVIIGLIFLGNKIYLKKLKDKVELIEIKKQKIQKENYEIKSEINNIINNQKIINLKETTTNKRDKIKKNFFILLSFLNENIFIQKYKLNNKIINVEGFVKEENILSEFIERVDSDRRIKYIKYDYIYLKNEKYIFSLEIEVN
ncbi:MAG: hypothetical protein WCQ76_01255 [Fusobacterium sp.]